MRQSNPCLWRNHISLQRERKVFWGLPQSWWARALQRASAGLLPLPTCLFWAFISTTVKQRSVHQLTASTLKLEPRRMHATTVSPRDFHVTYMRILSTHKCSYNYKLLSHFSVFTPESARTLQRQIAPLWLILSRVLCLQRYHLKHRLPSLRAGPVGGLVECEFTHRRKDQSYSCKSLENLVVILEPR